MRLNPLTFPGAKSNQGLVYPNTPQNGKVASKSDQSVVGQVTFAASSALAMEGYSKTAIWKDPTMVSVLDNPMQPRPESTGKEPLRRLKGWPGQYCDLCIT